MSLTEKEGVIWLDNQFVSWQDAKVHVLTHTLHYGLGVFEGVRAYEAPAGPIIFRLKDHTERLFRSAFILNIKMLYSKELLNEVQRNILAQNNLKSAYIRPIIFYGAEHLGVYPERSSVHVAVAAWEWGQYFKLDNAKKGIKAHISTYARNHVASSLLKAKANGNYINSALALQEAKNKGCDEAIMLDARGFVSEGSSANLFTVRNGIMYTPTTATILEGITRDTVMTLAKDLGISVIEKDLTRDDLYIADELFFTGTAAEITSVGEIDGRMIGDGHIGLVTQRLQQYYADVVRGKVAQYSHWLYE